MDLYGSNRGLAVCRRLKNLKHGKYTKRLTLSLALVLLVVMTTSVSADEWSGCYWIVDKDAYSGTDLYLVGYGYLGRLVYFDVSEVIYGEVHRGMIVNLWRDWEWDIWQGYECHCVPGAPGQCWPVGTVWLPVLP